MNFKKLLEDVKPHALVLCAFFLVSGIYYIKTFKGYSHKEDDVTQGLLKGTELVKYTDKDGEFPGWTNAIFSGMPSTMIKGKPSGNVIKSYNYLTPLNDFDSRVFPFFIAFVFCFFTFLVIKVKPVTAALAATTIALASSRYLPQYDLSAYPFQILFLSFIGFYLLMSAFKVKPLYGALAAIAYGFASYSISSVEAAHYTKVLAMALMPAILASLHCLFSGKYLTGGITLAFNMALQVYFFHYQITFYTIICLLVMGIYYLVKLVQEKQIRQLIIASLISILAVGAGVGANITKIKSTSKFADNTMRGGNDMAKVGEHKTDTKTGQNGLERDYAFDWSYGKGETFTLLIPNFYGGSSSEKLTTKSKFFEATQNEEALTQGLPMYHGDLTFTSGPIYIGSIIIFLFVLGMIIVKDRVKWALLALTIVSFILGWGKHFAVINDFLFDHLPYFNKFRTPMMAFCIAQVTIPLVGFLGIKQLYETWKDQKTNANVKGAVPKAAADTTVKTEWDMVKIAYYVVGGFCLLMAVAGPSFMDLGGVVDEQLKKGGNGNLISVLKEDRGSMLQADAFRSFVFISLSFGLLWAWYTKKAQRTLAIGLIGALAAVDLIGVDWRYLSWDEFTFEKGTVTDRVPDMADKQILSDPDIHYRVFDLTNDPFNDNEGAAFHKMIGGYDPAKLSRYQDVISNLFAQESYRDKGLDMLNCKYMIGTDSGNRRGVIPRTTMNGNAWFVQGLSPAKNAAEEMELLKKSEPKTQATYNSDFAQNKTLSSASFVLDSSSSAKLNSYHPDTMVYSVSNANNGFLVFSEIWYDNWRVEIDGKPAQLNKVDYTLRGLAVPAGKHSIKMVYDKGQSTTDNIEKYLSLAILLGMLMMIGLWVKNYFAQKA